MTLLWVAVRAELADDMALPEADQCRGPGCGCQELEEGRR